MVSFQNWRNTLKRSPWTHSAKPPIIGNTSIENFLDIIEQLLPHVGQKTAKDWADRIVMWRQALDALSTD